MTDTAPRVDVLVKFSTKQSQYAVPGVSVSVPADSDYEKLNEILHTYISQGEKHKDLPLFDFLVEGQLLRVPLQDRIQKVNKSLENVIDIEYFERLPPPTPKDSLNHDDWVAAVHCSKEWLLTGCYDNTLHLWDVNQLGTGNIAKAHKLTIPAHHAPVKAVSWVDSDSPIKTFISVAIDQAAYVWTWDSQNNSVECVSRGCGHRQSVECVAVDPLKSVFATGSWDTVLKIWSLDDKGNQKKVREEEEEEEDEDGVVKKKKTTVFKVHKMTPLMTLKGHSESVSGVEWTGENEIASASWDHSVRIWDTDIGGMKAKLPGNCAFFSISYSQKNRKLVTGCADNYIRLFDPRAHDGSVCQLKFVSHTKWVPSVSWSPDNEYYFISGSFDHSVKQWDTRSPKAPLFDLMGHNKKVLAVDWSNPNYMVSGSEDCTVKLFKAGSI